MIIGCGSRRPGNSAAVAAVATLAVLVPSVTSAVGPSSCRGSTTIAGTRPPVAGPASAVSRSGSDRPANSFRQYAVPGSVAGSTARNATWVSPTMP